MHHPPTHRAGKLGVKLAAVAAGGRRHCQPPDLSLSMVQRIDEQELLGMHRVVEGQASKLQVHTNVQRTAGT